MAANGDAWEIFTAAAACSTVPARPGKAARDTFEIDWSLARYLIELRELDAEETVDKLLALLRGLNE